MTLPSGDYPFIQERCEDLCILLYGFNDRGADEDRVIGFLCTCDLFELWDIQVGLEGIYLPTKGIALDLDVHQIQQGLVTADILG